MKHIIRIIGLIASVLLQSCQSLPALQSSQINLPKAWPVGVSSIDRQYTQLLPHEQSQTEQNWWRTFNDPVLDMLISKALLNNNDLRIAKSRVLAARAESSFAGAELMPEVRASLNDTRGNQSALFSKKAFNRADGNLSASWELDLFGQNKSRMFAAQALAQAEEANSQAVMIALLAEVARNYIDMRNYALQIEIVDNNLKGQRHTLESIQKLRNEAMATELDLQRAASQVSTTESQLPDLKTAYATTLTHLNILLGEPPGTLDEAITPSTSLPVLPKEILLSAPANIIEKRPDIIASERRFAASIASSKAARLEIFPKLSLLGLFGLDRAQFIDYKPWSLGANLVQPLLSFGRIEAQINAADARQQEAFFTYKKDVLEALGDMENALNAYINETNKNISLHHAVTQNQTSVDLAQKQFKEGYVDLLDVEVAERSLLQSESDMANSDAKVRKGLVAIYAAAGGGWDIMASYGPEKPN